MNADRAALGEESRIARQTPRWLLPVGWLALAIFAGGALIGIDPGAWRLAASRDAALAWSGAAGLAALFAAACLSARFLCRAFPLQPDRILFICGEHLAAGATLAAAWTLLAFGVAPALGPGLRPAFRSHAVEMVAAGICLYLLAAAVVYALRAAAAAWEAQTQTDRAQILAREAELRALRSQINPHFLFNSLHSISALTASDPERARRMCLQLAETFRLTLHAGARERISLAEELDLLRAYLAVEQVRYGERLRFEECVEKNLGALVVPSLLLQPLVENAVKHGIAGLTGPGRIVFTAERLDRRARLRLENDYDPEYAAGHRHGMGLANVRQRLEAAAPGATLHWSAQDRRFAVILTFTVPDALHGEAG